MTQDPDVLVLEVFKQNDALRMGVYEQKEAASTLRHYSQVSFPVTEINNLCQEVIFILNRIKKITPDPELINNLKKTARLLWGQLLTKPVKDRLHNAIVKDLVLSLDEELINIPWELLYDGKEFLCLKFNLGRLIRTKENLGAVQYRDTHSRVKMLILANPVGDLKAAYQEGLHIKNQFDRKIPQMSIDFKSTSIDTLYVKKNLRDYDIVHFAGHCEYDMQDASSSGWVLNDGKFTSRDIFALGEEAPLPGLIFSNACQSAKMSGDLLDTDYQAKAYSLASAFLFSGVRHYIGAIRKIEDPVSLSFAKEFYSRLIKGDSVGGSMRLARLKLIHEYGIESIVWAGYLLYGDPNFVLFRRRLKPAILRPTRPVFFNKKRIKRLSLVLPVAVLCIYLYIWLPSLNPDTYFLFVNSRKLFLKGKNEEVISLSNRIIEKEPLFLAVYPLLADTYQRLGDRENALKYYFDYAISSEKKQNKKHLTFAYIGIGWVYHLQGDYLKAFEFYNKAAALSRQTKDKLNEAVAMRKLAVWHMDKGEYDKALELLMKSSEINRERQHIYEHRYNLACDYFDIGLVFTNKDDLIAAKEFYAKSVALFEKLKLKNELSDYYFNLGEIYLFEKQYQKALECYLRGLAIDKAQGNKANLTSDYNMLGELYAGMDNLTEAEESFLESAAVSKAINARPELADASYNLGLLYAKRNQKNKAREYFRQAQEIYSLTDTVSYEEVKQKLLDLNQ